jgi:hypothetical protein
MHGDESFSVPFVLPACSHSPALACRQSSQTSHRQRVPAGHSHMSTSHNNQTAVAQGCAEEAEKSHHTATVHGALTALMPGGGSDRSSLCCNCICL